MKKHRTLRRTLARILALVLGISVGALLCSSPYMQAAIKEPVTQEYYEMMKENAMNVARTLDDNVLNDETLTADFYFSEDELVVTVESFKAKVISKIPISNHAFNIEDGAIAFQGNIEFEKVEYEEENELEPAWWYIVTTIGLSAIVAYAVYKLFFPSRFES